MNQLLYTINDVFGSYLATDNQKTHYFIPFYQRGYKWTKIQRLQQQKLPNCSISKDRTFAIY